MLRILIPFFPNASIFFSDGVIIVSIISVIYGSIIAIMQEDIKKMIAYSSVAHMGFVTAGIFSLNQIGISASVFQMFSHGIVSSALFLCIGVLYERLHSRNFKDFGGITKKMPSFAIVLMVFTMSSAGLPATSGFIGEFMTIVSVYQKSFYFSLAIAFSVIFGALYMLYMYKKTMFGKASNPEIAHLKDLTKYEKFSLYSLSIITIGTGVYPNSILKFVPNLGLIF
jgi:NADH-quinone oxidoreductase subunit M